MTIGEALKKERIKRGLSVRKMAGTIIDPSSYNKVEKNMRNIGSEALVRLIFMHNININEFFNNISSNYAPSKLLYKIELESNMRSAFSNRDLVKIQNVHNKIMNLKHEEILKLRSIVAVAYLKHAINDLDEHIKIKIFEQLDKKDNLSNDIEAIRLFANVMPIFTNEQLNYLMQSYANKIIKNDNLSELDIKRFAVASVNYLRACYERKIPLNETMVQIKDYILNSDDTSLLAYKGLVKLSLAAITGNITLAKKLKQELIDIGYDQVKNWKF